MGRQGSANSSVYRLNTFVKILSVMNGSTVANQNRSLPRSCYLLPRFATALRQTF